ncbi:MAG TPA: DUF4339 domain-containing protein, partial [Candidatus Limnocylindria bacterium]|nr:DUF4339 domain-containing protein [Candidatus Limnocylindria bacterium]
MYRIIGGDGKEYGPVSADEVRRWIGERRLQLSSLIRVEDTAEWKPLSLFPEFSSAFAFVSAPAPFAMAATPMRTQQSNGMATTGLVFSCFALVCCGCSPAAILGIVFSYIGLSQANRDPEQVGKPLAIA